MVQEIGTVILEFNQLDQILVDHVQLSFHSTEVLILERHLSQDSIGNRLGLIFQTLQGDVAQRIAKLLNTLNGAVLRCRNGLKARRNRDTGSAVLFHFLTGVGNDVASGSEVFPVRHALVRDIA